MEPRGGFEEEQTSDKFQVKACDDICNVTQGFDKKQTLDKFDVRVSDLIYVITHGLDKKQTPEEFQARTGNNEYITAQEFDDIPIIQDNQSILDGLFCNNYDSPSSFLGKALPMILTPPYKSLFAQSCWGKTLTSVLSALARVDVNVKHLHLLYIVSDDISGDVVYTDYFKKFLDFVPVKVHPLFDSFDDPVCCNYYDEKAQIVIATPIYIDEYINEINLKCVRVLIIDDIDKCFRFFKDRSY